MSDKDLNTMELIPQIPGSESDSASASARDSLSQSEEEVRTIYSEGSISPLPANYRRSINHDTYDYNFDWRYSDFNYGNSDDASEENSGSQSSQTPSPSPPPPTPPHPPLHNQLPNENDRNETNYRAEPVNEPVSFNTIASFVVPILFICGAFIFQNRDGITKGLHTLAVLYEKVHKDKSK
ncbi:hypothetical protein DFJ63DRAFT_336570 [Scheffersomyces coipomensis]|uniref:uncharacterized protein n=1 Tax=Scheffersomyces coipomensis TaxID=1788519 RepID=UPI00315C9FDE